MSRVTLREVAAAAHVSIATASIALRGMAGVSDETRDRVVVAAARLGYRPHAGARSLRRGYRPVVGVLLDPLLLEGDLDSDAQFVRRFVTGLGRHAGTQGASVVMLDPGGDASEVDVLVWIRIGPAIVPPTRRTSGTPVVEVTAAAPGVCTDALSHDYQGMTDAVVATLAERGSHRPALIRIRSHAAHLRCFELAYRNWCQQEGVVPGVFEFGPDETSARAVGSALVAAGHDAAFLCTARFRSLVLAGVHAAVVDSDVGRFPLAVLAETRPVGLSFDQVTCLSLEGDASAAEVLRVAVGAAAGDRSPPMTSLPWAVTTLPGP